MVVRRVFLGILGALLTSKSARANSLSSEPPNQGTSAEMTGFSVKPRHVLCFLGGPKSLSLLSHATSIAINDFATGFSIDHTYSQDEPDENMSRSFEVCWDLVYPNAWSKSDEVAVANHRSVLYVLGPPMTSQNAVTVSSSALLLIDRLIEAGALAVKGESAGIAHGLTRWRELIEHARSAMKSDNDLALSQICRLAFSKRPLATDERLVSVGFHLVGLPEVYVPKSLGSEREIVAMIDGVADDILRKGLAAMLENRGARMTDESSYNEDEFKFNPYGAVELPS